MRSKYHRIWLANNNGVLAVGFAESDDKIKDSVSRYHHPNQKSARRLSRILNLSNETPFIFLHPTGPVITYYIKRRRKKPAPAPKPALALVA